MRLLKRVKFAFKYDIEPTFIVYAAPNQTAIQFIRYKDAKDFVNKQIQTKPKIMVVITRKD